VGGGRELKWAGGKKRVDSIAKEEKNRRI